MTNICSESITTAKTGQIAALGAVSGFNAPRAISLQARFTYVASAATGVDAYVQTTIDGSNWFDIAEFNFTTASAQKFQNCVGETAVNSATTLTDGTLTANTSINGFLGVQYRVKYTSVGTYGAGTSLAVDVQAR